MDFFRTRAVPALAALACCAALGARADCGAINGTYADDSSEKPDGMAVTLSSFASPKDRTRLIHQERSGPPATFGGSGQVMQRPKSVKLVKTVAVTYGAELKLRYLDEAGKMLAETNSITPRKWNCVSGRLVRKFETMSGLGEIMRKMETEQVLMAAPGGDLAFIETSTAADGKTPPKKTEVHFKRIGKS